MIKLGIRNVSVFVAAFPEKNRHHAKLNGSGGGDNVCLGDLDDSDDTVPQNHAGLLQSVWDTVACNRCRSGNHAMRAGVTKSTALRSTEDALAYTVHETEFDLSHIAVEQDNGRKRGLVSYTWLSSIWQKCVIGAILAIQWICFGVMATATVVLSAQGADVVGELIDGKMQVRMHFVFSTCGLVVLLCECATRIFIDQSTMDRIHGITLFRQTLLSGFMWFVLGCFMLTVLQLLHMEAVILTNLCTDSKRTNNASGICGSLRCTLHVFEYIGLLLLLMFVLLPSWDGLCRCFRYCTRAHACANRGGTVHTVAVELDDGVVDRDVVAADGVEVSSILT